MNASKPIIDQVALSAFAQRHKLSELALFGSILRDDFSDTSDVDVLFALLPGEQMSIEKYLEMKDELASLFGRPVDIVQRNLVQNPYRRESVLRTRKIIYASLRRSRRPISMTC